LRFHVKTEQKRQYMKAFETFVNSDTLGSVTLSIEIFHNISILFLIFTGLRAGSRPYFYME